MQAGSQTISGSRLSILDSTSDYAFGAVDNVFLAVWRGANTQGNLQLQEQRLRGLTAAHPRNCGFVCVIENSSPSPNSECRALMSDTLSKLGETLGCVACVMEGSGMRVALTRSVLTGVTLLRKNPQPVSFFDDLSSAQRWMAEIMKMPAGLSLHDEVDLLRRSMPVRGSASSN